MRYLLCAVLLLGCGGADPMGPAPAGKLVASRAPASAVGSLAPLVPAGVLPVVPLYYGDVSVDRRLRELRRAYAATPLAEADATLCRDIARDGLVWAEDGPRLLLLWEVWTTLEPHVTPSALWLSYRTWQRHEAWAWEDPELPAATEALLLQLTADGWARCWARQPGRYH